MIDFIKREKRKYTVVKRDRLSIKEKLRFLKEFLVVGEMVEFDKLYDKEGGITDIVISFISLLELSRLKKIAVYQNEDKGPIYVEAIQKLDDFDIDSANGFDETPYEEERLKNEQKLQEEKNLAIKEEENLIH